MEKQFSIVNPGHVCHGVKSLVLNGEKLEGNAVPVAKLKDTNAVEVILG